MLFFDLALLHKLAEPRLVTNKAFTFELKSKVKLVHELMVHDYYENSMNVGILLEKTPLFNLVTRMSKFISENPELAHDLPRHYFALSVLHIFVSFGSVDDHYCMVTLPHENFETGVYQITQKGRNKTQELIEPKSDFLFVMPPEVVMIKDFDDLKKSTYSQRDKQGIRFDSTLVKQFIADQLGIHAFLVNKGY